MAITKYLPSQFRDLFLGGSKQATFSVTPASILTGAVGSVTGVSWRGAQVGDIILVTLAAPVAGVHASGDVTAAGVVAFTFVNASGASFGGAARVLNATLLRPATV